jgi:hypothetical protein
MLKKIYIFYINECKSVIKTLVFFLKKKLFVF